MGQGFSDFQRVVRRLPGEGCLGFQGTSVGYQHLLGAIGRSHQGSSGLVGARSPGAPGKCQEGSQGIWGVLNRGPLLWGVQKSACEPSGPFLETSGSFSSELFWLPTREFCFFVVEFGFLSAVWARNFDEIFVCGFWCGILFSVVFTPLLDSCGFSCGFSISS